MYIYIDKIVILSNVNRPSSVELKNPCAHSAKRIPIENQQTGHFLRLSKFYSFDQGHSVLLRNPMF